MEHRKTVLRKIPSPLSIVTSSREGEVTGAVITFLVQTSLEPPLIAMAIRPDSEIYEFLNYSRKAAVHFPGKGQREMTKKFFRIKERSDTSLNGYSFRRVDGYVHLDDISMYLTVDVMDLVKTGDHHLFICKVTGANLVEDYPALQLSDTKWKYGG